LTQSAKNIEACDNPQIDCVVNPQFYIHTMYRDVSFCSPSQMLQYQADISLPMKKSSCPRPLMFLTTGEGSMPSATVNIADEVD
jgi:hypothetical protein